MFEEFFSYENVEMHYQCNATYNNVVLKKRIGGFETGRKIRSIEVDFHGGVFYIFIENIEYEFGFKATVI